MGLMLSALALNCTPGTGTEDDTKVPGNNKTVVTLDVTLPADLVWQAGDQVAINGLESEAVTEEAAGGATYSFQTTTTETPLVVVAPYEILSGLNQVTIPSFQTYAEGFDRSVYGMAGIVPEVVPASEGDDKNFVASVELNPVMGVVSLPLTLDAAATGDVLVKQLSFTALNGAPLAGVWGAEAVVNTDEAGVTTYDVKLVAEGKSTATTVLECGEGVAINTASPVYFNLVVPAGVYTGGFEVVVTDTADHNYIFNLTEDVAVERGAKVELAASVFTVIEKSAATLSVTIADQGIVWQEGDAVVCNNTLSTNTVAATAAGTQTAEFSFDAVAYPYSVFYPAEFYTTSGSLRF